jgi:hypothetical protein
MRVPLATLKASPGAPGAVLLTVALSGLSALVFVCRLGRLRG